MPVKLLGAGRSFLGRLFPASLICAATQVACGGGEASQRADGDPQGGAGSALTSAQAGPLSFGRDVAPILFDECASCHRPGTAAPFSLLTYEDAKPLAERIAAVTESRTMPPWLPEPGYGEFVGERRLSKEQVSLIRRWVDEGAPEGDPEDLPPLAEWAEGWQLGTPDLVIEMREPFTLPAAGPDVFRNFVIPIPGSSARHVRAVELRPGNPRAVHHALMMIDRTSASRRLDELDPVPGYESEFHSGSAENPSGFFLGWTPGNVPHAGTDDMSWLLEEDTDFVVQLHMRPTGEPETVTASVGFYFADRPPTRTPALIALSSRTIDIPPGRSDYAISDSYELPVDVEVLSVYPHAHFLGDRMESQATLPDGTSRWLFRIDDWDFNWQDEYRYVTPIELPKGSVISMRFTYDNSEDNPQNPNRPPKRVTFGKNSTDEMGDLIIQVLTRDSAALALLQRDYANKWAGIRLDGLRHALRLDPNDALSHFKMGVALAERGDLDEAIRHYQQALEIDGSLAEAHSNLGNVLRGRGELDGAIEHYRATLQAKPDLAAAHYNLAVTLAAQGNLDEAIGHYRSALAIDEELAEAHNNLGEALMSVRRPSEALPHLRRAVELRADYAEAHNNLALLSASAGRMDEAIEHFRETIRLRPDMPGPITLLAEILATHPDAGIRDAPEAIRLAERAAELTARRHPAVLDVLAAAYASDGQFDRAVTTAETAIAVAAAARADALAERIRQRLALYRQSKPFLAAP